MSVKFRTLVTDATLREPVKKETGSLFSISVLFSLASAVADTFTSLAQYTTRSGKPPRGDTGVQLSSKRGKLGDESFNCRRLSALSYL